MEQNIDQVIGQNIERFRKKYGMTQEQVAKFLDIDRVMVTYYETGKRPAPMPILNKLADLFCIDVAAMIEENEAIAKSNAAFAFRAGEINQEDLKHIAQFHRIVGNYIKMKELERKIKND